MVTFVGGAKDSVKGSKYFCHAFLSPIIFATFLYG